MIDTTIQFRAVLITVVLIAALLLAFAQSGAKRMAITTHDESRAATEHPLNSVSRPSHPALALIGVAVTDSLDTKSVAVLSVDGGPQRLFHTGEEIYAGVLLEEIRAEGVLIGYGAVHEFLYLRDPHVSAALASAVEQSPRARALARRGSAIARQ